MVRVGFVGNGLRTSRLWFDALARCAGRFEAVCDADPNQAAQLAQSYGARWSFAHLAEMLAETQPQLVLVGGLDPAQRLQYLRQLLRGRASVIMIDPPTPSPATWDRLSRQARQAGRFVMLGLPYRYSPATERLQQLLGSAVLDEPVGVSLALRRQRVGFADQSGPLNVAFETVFESVDRLCNLLGPARWVAAAAAEAGGISAALRMQAGAIAGITAVEVEHTDAAGVRLELTGQDGKVAELVDDTLMRCRSGSEVLAQYTARMAGGAQPSQELGHAPLVAEAIAAVQAGRQPATTLRQLRHSLLAARAVWTSAAGARSVSLGGQKGGKTSLTPPKDHV